MKWLALVMVGMLMFSVASAEELQSESSLPGIMPDSPFYFVKQFAERLQYSFAGTEQKAMLSLEFAEERLIENQKMLGEGKFQYTEQLMNQYQNNMNLAYGLCNNSDIEGCLQVREQIQNRVQLHTQLMEQLNAQYKNSDMQNSITIAENVESQVKLCATNSCGK